MTATQGDAIAELQRANAELRRERDAALAREAALAEVLDIINSSPGDPGPVFEAILDKAHQLCGAAVGSLMTYDGTYVRARAARGFPEEHEALIRQPFRLQPFGGLSARQSIHGEQPKTFEAGLERLIHGERVFNIADFKTLETQPDSEVNRSMIERTNVRSCLTVALRKDGAFVGYISAFRLEVRPFAEAEVALLESFAAQAVVAMENARLITEQREALEQQTATAEVLQVINASPGDLAPVFDAMLEKAMRLCGGTMGGIFTFDGDHSVTLAVRGVTAAFQEYNDKYPMHKIQPGTVSARIIETRSPVQNPDVTAGEGYRAGYPYARALVELGGIRAVLAVPLLKDGVAVGMVAIYRREAGAFSDKEIALLENFAAQAVIAMENARLITEQKEALEQQTATAEVLQVINSSPGDLAPVFDAILEKAHLLCGAAKGSLVTYDGEHFHTVATRGLSERYAAILREARDDHNPAGSPPQRLVAGESLVEIPDFMTLDFPIPHAAAELEGARTVLYVALRRDEALLGYITAYRQEVRPFSDKQIALLQNFAAQAVIAMENARLLGELREALDEQTATAEVLQVINASPGNLAPVFDAMLEKAMRLCGAAFGMLRSFDGEQMHTVATRGVPSAFAKYSARNALTPMLATGPARALETGRPAQTMDITEGVAYQSGEPGSRALVDLGGARTILHIPLFKDQTSIGLFSFYRQEVRAFTGKQIALLENFAAQAVIAMENARLLTEQREALEQQTATAEVLQVINASPGNLDPVFDAILEKAHRLCGAAKGGLETFDGEGFRSSATRGLSEQSAQILREPRRYYGRGPVREQLLKGADLVLLTDPGNLPGPLGRALVELEGIRSILFVPLRRGGSLLGYVTAYRMDTLAFSDKQIALLKNFAAQAAIAIENARLLNEIRQRQAELRTTFDNMGDGVAMFDTDLRLVAWNRNFQRIIDLPDTLLETQLRYNDYLRHLAERGEFGTIDIEAELSLRIEDTDKELRLERVRPDGRVIEVRRNAVSGGGFVLIYSDITERKRSEQEIRAARDAAETALRELRTAQANLIQAEKMASLGQLTAGIAHEIKNPLNFVNNFSALSTELIDELRDVLAPEPLGETARTEVDDLTALLKGNLEKVVQHGQRADGIVRSMLDHSRGSSGERRMVDLNMLIDEALNLAYHGARAQDQSFNIALERDFGAGIAPIDVNPQDITRVFLNLFSNGFYATTRRARDGGDAGFVPTLKVTTRDAGEAVEIRVRDNGTGIPADIRDKLFQPFFTTKPTGEGTGLGLSITYDIVTQQHGGSIAVDSEVGEYSELTIRLPRNP